MTIRENWRQLPRSMWTSAEAAAYAMELSEKARQHGEMERISREERERQSKESAMERFLAQRGRVWMDHNGGALPPPEVIASWREEFMDDVFAGEDSPQERRRRERSENVWRVGG